MDDCTGFCESDAVPASGLYVRLDTSRPNSSGSDDSPNPTAPYYLQIYTSTFVVPFVIEAGSALEFDWVVPFVPGTQYQICMFDSKGTSGGCQAVYTVYQAPNTTADNPPTCFNLTYPRPETQLGVNALVSTGPFSQFGWIDQCTDLQVTPTNGTPPYIMTVAPALHPPYNISSPDMSPINWTVSLSWGAPFFVSLVDSSGMTWASGPLHSGGGGTTECLALDGAASGKKSVAPAVAIGAGVGGLVVGLIIGLLSAIAFTYWTNRRRPKRPTAVRESTNMLLPESPARGHYSDLPSTDSRDGAISFMRDQGYRIEPFILPAEQEFGGHARGASSPPPTSPLVTSPTATSGNFAQYLNAAIDGQTGSGSGSSGSRRTPSTTATIPLQSASPEPPRPPGERASSHVYVVHHDGGGAPISVYTEDGAEVVELPPRYTAPGPSSPLSPTATNRRAGPIPEKPSARRAVS
ncbi:hypothetical protein EIP91_009698 [Steccherinum ochraceum]|uniref:Uncharacterized protein n=1 Tax=Steccherinum ochraceum TaxID=92696 RepID=A0A4R0RK46_9APHY|nr:hypothetical protein EIP91_009698 [Steccherinum ochraceum]